MQMTYRKAIIILDRLVTTKRIEVDRAELREAVKVAQKALNIVADLPPNHGRLIDADEVEERLQKYWYEEYPNQEADYHRAFMDSNACIKDLPTIIEAEANE